MKTSPSRLRELADFISQHDDPDTTTALRWAADDIDELKKCVNFFASVIKSGESWTCVCDEMLRKTKF